MERIEGAILDVDVANPGAVAPGLAALAPAQAEGASRHLPLTREHDRRSTQARASPEYELAIHLTDHTFSMMACTSRLWFLPWCVNSFVWFALFLPSWLAKDRSLSRHPGFRAYQRRTGVLIPWVFGTGWWPELSCDTSGTGGVSAWVC